jgi:hypothetical protein
MDPVKSFVNKKKVTRFNTPNIDGMDPVKSLLCNTKDCRNANRPKDEGMVPRSSSDGNPEVRQGGQQGEIRRNSTPHVNPLVQQPFDVRRRRHSSSISSCCSIIGVAVAVTAPATTSDAEPVAHVRGRLQVKWVDDDKNTSSKFWDDWNHTVANAWRCRSRDDVTLSTSSLSTNHDSALPSPFGGAYIGICQPLSR